MDVTNLVLASAISFCAYTALFILLTCIFRSLLSSFNLSHGSVLHVSNQFVSGIQSLITLIVGVIICTNTSHDVMYASHTLGTLYPCICTGYAIYDTLCMYYVYVHRHNLIFSSDSVKQFLQDRFLMVAHHILLMVLLLPIVLWLRNGKGDFFIGSFFLAEGSTPMVAFRSILSEIGMKRSFIYKVNGLLMISAFFCCRILLFPFMFNQYALYARISLYQVPFRLPYVCITACTCIFCLQVYWFILMLAGARKVLCDKSYNGVDDLYHADRIISKKE